jgi:hypothetical protein
VGITGSQDQATFLTEGRSNGNGRESEKMLSRMEIGKY